MSRVEEECNDNFILQSEEVTLVDGEYKLEVCGNFSYTINTFQELYDKDGNFIKELVVDTRIELRKETKIREHISKSIIQCDFKFIEAPIGRCWTQSQITRAKNALRDLFPTMFIANLCDSKKHDFYSASYHKLGKNKKLGIIKRTGLLSSHHMKDINEICCIGNTYTICSTKKCPSLEEYKQRKEKAIEKWPNSKKEIEDLYSANVGVVMLRREINPVDSFLIDIREDDCIYGYSVHINCFLGNRELNKVIRINKHEDFDKLANLQYSLKEKLYTINNKQKEMLEDAKAFVLALFDSEPKNQIELSDKFKKPKEIKEVKEITPDRASETFYRPVKTYLIKNKTNGFYKIGRSVAPFFREKTLQSQEPVIDIVKTWDNNIEDELQAKYKPQRLRGEWFELTKIQVRYICTHYK